MSTGQALLDNTKLSQAYLLVGENAADFARKLIQKIYCPRSCGTCSHCHKLSRGTHLDLIWVVRSGKRISIDQVRELQQKALYPPVEAPRKVYVIENVEDLSLEAANSLLKILEMPPEFLIFVLLARSANILPTILSRCQVIKLPKPARAETERHLRECGLNEAEIEYLLSVTKGSLPAQIALDSPLLAKREQLRRQLAALADADLLAEAANEDILIRREALLAVLQRLKDWNAAQVLSVAATMSKFEPDVIESFIREATYWCRDLLAVQHGESVFNGDCLAELRAIHADSIRLAEAVRALEAAPWKLQRNANVQLLLESLFFTMRAARV